MGLHRDRQVTNQTALLFDRLTREIVEAAKYIDIGAQGLPGVGNTLN